MEKGHTEFPASQSPSFVKFIQIRDLIWFVSKRSDMICEQKILYDLLAKDLIRFVSKRSDMICLSKISDMICKQNVCKQTASKVSVNNHC